MIDAPRAETKLESPRFWKGLALFLILIILIWAVVSGYIYLETKYRTEGFEQGLYAIAFEQTTTGNIFYLNESSHLNSKPLSEVCG